MISLNNFVETHAVSMLCMLKLSCSVRCHIGQSDFHHDLVGRSSALFLVIRCVKTVLLVVDEVFTLFL